MCPFIRFTLLEGRRSLTEALYLFILFMCSVWPSNDLAASSTILSESSKVWGWRDVQGLCNIFSYSRPLGRSCFSVLPMTNKGNNIFVALGEGPLWCKCHRAAAQFNSTASPECYSKQAAITYTFSALFWWKSALRTSTLSWKRETPTGLYV